MNKIIPALAAALALGACATMPTTYQPSTGPEAIGFSEYRIENGRYRITFRGGPGAPAAQVTDYALLRAADLAIADGFDWFRVADRSTTLGETRGPRVGLGIGSGSGGYRGYRGYGGGVSVGLGTSFALGGGPTISSSLEVVMGKGPRPADGDAYDARDLRRTLGGRI